MADAQAKIKAIFSTEDAIRQFRAWTREAKGGMRQIDQSTRQTGQSARGTGKQFGGWMGSLAGSLRTAGGLLIAMRGIQTVASLVRKEIEAVAEQSKNARDEQKPFNLLLREAVDLIPQGGRAVGLTPEYLRDAAIGTKVDPTSAIRAFREAMTTAAGGPEEKKRAVETAREIIDLRPDLARSDSQLADIVKGIIGQKRAFGGSTEAQLAQFFQAAGQSQVGDFQQFSKNIARMTPALGALGFDQREAFAYLSGVGTAGFDTEGSSTATNATKFAAQVREELKVAGLGGIKGLDMFRFISGENIEGFDSDEMKAKAKKIQTKLLGVFSEGMSEADFNEFMAGAHGKRALRGELRARERFRIFLMQMIQPDAFQGDEAKTAAQLTREAYKALPANNKEAVAAFRQTEEDINRLPQGLMLKRDQAFQQTQNQLKYDPNLEARAAAEEMIEGLITSTARGQYGTATEKFMVKSMMRLRNATQGTNIKQEFEAIRNFANHQRRMAQRVENDSNRQLREGIDTTMLGRFFGHEVSKETIQENARLAQQQQAALSGFIEQMTLLIQAIEKNKTATDGNTQALERQGEGQGVPVQDPAAGAIGNPGVENRFQQGGGGGFF